MTMRILIVAPAPTGSNRGNRITADRWKLLLQALGHQVAVKMQFDPADKADCLIALHARHSYQTVRDYRETHSACPIVVCLTGTDLHVDFQPDQQNSRLAESRENYTAVSKSLEIANAIVGLEPRGLSKLPVSLRDKSHIILQSASPFLPEQPKPVNRFLISVLGHLRPIKDPLRTAIAARSLPQQSTIFVEHMGAALDDSMRCLAEREMVSNGRYTWLGNLPHPEAMQRLASSHLMVLSSFHEGAPSVISEAIANRIPIIASRIDATIGLLGASYPGFFEAGNTDELAKLLSAAENDPAFLEELNQWTEPLIAHFKPNQEKEAWRRLLDQLSVPQNSDDS